MNTSRRYSPEVRERAVRMVLFIIYSTWEGTWSVLSTIVISG
jgi:hypothetical protein